MLIWEVLPNYIYVTFIAYLEKYIQEVRLLKIPPANLPIVVGIQGEEDSHYDCVCVPVLKLWGLLQEF